MLIVDSIGDCHIQGMVFGRVHASTEPPERSKPSPPPKRCITSLHLNTSSHHCAASTPPPQRVADALLSGRMYKLEALKENFEYKDPAGRDHVRDPCLGSFSLRCCLTFGIPGGLLLDSDCYWCRDSDCYWCRHG